MASTESEIRALLDRQAEAMRDKDIDRLMAVYSPDVVYFDVVPPLQFIGSTALRARFLRWFGGFQGPIDLKLHDLRVRADEQIAVAYWFSRAGGTLTSGREVGFWVRATNCCQRSPGGWWITHEHVSLPVDLGRGAPAMDLVP